MPSGYWLNVLQPVSSAAASRPAPPHHQRLCGLTGMKRPTTMFAMSISPVWAPTTQNLVWADAHSHLQDPRLAPHLPNILDRARAAGVQLLHVAATREADWPAVAALADQHPGLVISSFGLHPWFIQDRSARWLQNLRDRLAARPAGIGEIGLDARVGDGLDVDRAAVFRAQLELSYELARPASLHCRDAWGAMLEILLALPPHPAGILIHAYSGPPEALPALAQKNVHISFGGTLDAPRTSAPGTTPHAPPPAIFCSNPTPPTCPPPCLPASRPI